MYFNFLTGTDKFKSIVAFTVLLLINLLFVYKYVERITAFAGIITFMMALFYIGTWTLRKRVVITKKQYAILTTGILILFICLGFILFAKVPLLSLNVDRWNTITTFWESFFNQEYVYYASSYLGNPPGPMPFYFILALPFMLAGDLGVMTLFGSLLFMALVARLKISINNKLWSFLFLVSSFFILWEIVTRSNIFFNSVIILALIIWFSAINKSHNLSLFLNAFVAGLLLSTRSVFIIPYIIVFLYALRKKEISPGRLIIYGIIAIFAFVLTFIPFILNHFEDFMKINPFVIQSTFFIPFSYNIGFMLLAAGSSFLCKNTIDVYFYCGVTLFVSISIYFVYHIIAIGFTTSYFDSFVDISYFIFSAPFLIYYLIKTGNDGETQNEIQVS